MSIRLLEQFLDKSPDFPVTLGDVANLLNLEKTYCSKVFRDITGHLFSGWLRRLRIGKATEMLRSSDLAITHVAHAVGYPDVTTFERNFRKVVGMCPTSYRRAGHKRVCTSSGQREDAPAY